MRSFLAGEGTGEEIRILGWLFFNHEVYPGGHHVRHGVLPVTECTDEFSLELDQSAYAQRQAHFARPLKRRHHLAWVLRERALPKSPLGKACDYLLAHWKPA
jgi:hypothetical protein